MGGSDEASSQSCDVGLEKKFDGELQLPRGISGCDGTEAPVGSSAIGSLIVDLVQSIEGLRAEVDLCAFAPQAKSLMQTEIQLRKRWSPGGVASGIPKRMAGVCRQYYGGCVEISIQC